MTFGSTDNLRFDLSLHSDSSNRVVLSSGGRSFLLGPRTNPIDPSGRPEIDLVPEAGDEVSFTGDRSLVGWPTPFEINLMTRSPWWKRYVYYRLVWSKGSRAKLEMLWALRAGLLHPRRMDRAGYDVEWADRPAPGHHSACDVRTLILHRDGHAISRRKAQIAQALGRRLQAVDRDRHVGLASVIAAAAPLIKVDELSDIFQLPE